MHFKVLQVVFRFDVFSFSLIVLVVFNDEDCVHENALLEIDLNFEDVPLALQLLTGRYVARLVRSQCAMHLTICARFAAFACAPTAQVSDQIRGGVFILHRGRGADLSSTFKDLEQVRRLVESHAED